MNRALLRDELKELLADLCTRTGQKRLLTRMALGFALKPLPATVCAPLAGGRSGAYAAWAGA